MCCCRDIPGAAAHKNTDSRQNNIKAGKKKGDKTEEGNEPGVGGGGVVVPGTRRKRKEEGATEI